MAPHADRARASRVTKHTAATLNSVAATMVQLIRSVLKAAPSAPVDVRVGAVEVAAVRAAQAGAARAAPSHHASPLVVGGRRRLVRVGEAEVVAQL